MLAMERKSSGLFEDVADYAKDGRLTEPSDGERYEWRKMIDAVKMLGRPLTDEEAEQYRVK
ncbi:MAG: hypothetical protein NC079_01150 [Clostridium sp.]|nr:hypothetical protein [Acetatifactor muris]MCM1526045.1 hypothetical protein [Bacteroides sp.]MCM1562195.1 hypothetical protein [Clostridium sp.]